MTTFCWRNGRLLGHGIYSRGKRIIKCSSEADLSSCTWKLRHQTECNCRQTTETSRLWNVWIVSKWGHDTKLTWILKNDAHLDSWDHQTEHQVQSIVELWWPVRMDNDRPAFPSKSIKRLQLANGKAWSMEARAYIPTCRCLANWWRPEWQVLAADGHRAAIIGRPNGDEDQNDTQTSHLHTLTTRISVKSKVEHVETRRVLWVRYERILSEPQQWLTVNERCNLGHVLAACE